MGDLSRKEVERRVKHRDPLKELDLTGMKLDDFNFEGASFTKCKFTGSSFKGSIIAFSRFDECLFDECLWDCDVANKRLHLSLAQLAIAIAGIRTIGSGKPLISDHAALQREINLYLINI